MLERSSPSPLTRRGTAARNNANPPRSAGSDVVVFDDFITRGDTLSHVARAIQSTNPQVTVYGVGLAKTERLGFWEQQGITINGPIKLKTRIEALFQEVKDEFPQIFRDSRAHRSIRLRRSGP